MTFPEPTVTERLEAMIDKHGLAHVLVGLVCVCDEKAEHLRVNWQDSKSARCWESDARKIEKIADKVST
jgi:hypothetical protein